MSVRKVELTLAANDADALAKIRNVDLGLDKLKEAAKAKAATIGVDDKSALYQLASFNRSLDKLAIRNANPRITVDGVDRDELALLKLDASLDKIGAKKVSPVVDVDTKTAASNVEKLTGDLGEMSSYAMPALIGGLVAVGSHLATAGFGLGAFGAAAIGTLKPIASAAQATGGLRANLKTLDPEQQNAAKSLLGLSGDYHTFVKSLEPQVVQDFGDAIKPIGGLLKDLQPVAKASGVALDGVFRTLGKDFQDSEWQQFFGYLKTNAGPDIAQLGQLFSDLANDIPPLIQALHPLGTQVITNLDDFTRLEGGIYKLGSQADIYGNKIHAGTSLTTRFGDAVKQAATQIAGPGVTAGQKIVGWLEHYNSSSGEAKGKTAALSQATSGLSGNISTAAGNIAAEVTQLGKQKAALETAMGALNNYVDATITQSQDLQTLKQALQASGDKIGLNTDKQRASFSAAQQYIENTDKTATAALSAHRGIDTQISTIQKALPVLDHVRGKTAAYRQELQTLKSILDKLRAERVIHDIVDISVNGALPVGSVSTSSGGYVNGGGGGHLLADGGPVRGPGTGTSDSVSARLSNGEYVIRAAAAKAVGMGLLERINSAGGGRPKRGDGYHFAEGGFNFPAPSQAAIAPSGGGEQTVRVILEASNDDLVKAVVKALRYDIRTNGGGDVQKYLGWGHR